MPPPRCPFILALSLTMLAAGVASADLPVPFSVPTLNDLPLIQRDNFPLRPLPRQSLPVIDECTCTATVFVQGAGGSVFPVTVVTPISTTSFQPGPVPPDTCPSGSQLNVRWHSAPRPASGYRYRLAQLDFLEQPVGDFIEVGPQARSVSYDLGVAPQPDAPTEWPGAALFTLGARGLASSYVDSLRAFIVNYSPDTWWSGPDPNSPSLQSKPNGERYARLVGGHLPDPIVGSLMSDDSTFMMPSMRPNRRTFFEIWKDTVWVREEGDTVHMNSWVVVHNGGFDRDSPYAVEVNPMMRWTDPNGDYLFPEFIAQDGPVLMPGPANGSPIGFRSAASYSLTPNGRPSHDGLSYLYPVMDPASFHSLFRIAGYHNVPRSGRAFLVAEAQDGDGARDLRVPDGRELVTRVENGTATPYERSLRPLVLTFEVNKAPYFVTENPLFVPGPQTTFTSRVWNLRLIAEDEDPFLAGPYFTVPGMPFGPPVFRRRIKVHGKDAQGNDFTYVDPLTYMNVPQAGPDIIPVTVPAALAPGPCTIEVELCDCQFCEEQPGTGRCVIAHFPVMYAPPGSSVATTPGSLHPQTRTWTTALLAPYPNPSRGAATIPFTLARAGQVSIEIFDLAGHRVKTFEESLPPGSHSRTWTGLNDEGRFVGAGLYFVRLRTGDHSASRKLLVAH